MRPERITLHAKDKEPIKDNNSRFVHFLFERQEKIILLRSENWQKQVSSIFAYVNKNFKLFFNFQISYYTKDF